MTTKKNISQNDVNSYIPPRLVKAQQGWYIIYYHLVAGVWLRERKTFNLNRISNKTRRMERAREIIDQLDGRLSSVPAEGRVVEDLNVLGDTPAVEAIEFAVGLINQSPKKETRKSFNMIRKMLIDFLHKKRLGDITIQRFDGKVAQAFMDAAVQRGVGNTTYNNYRGFATIVFNKLIKRDYISINPFHKIDKVQAEEKRRRPFSLVEREIVLAELYRTDYWLFILVVLHFLTLIRRTECYRLKFSNFNLKEGYLMLPKTATKNKKASIVTLPDSFRELLTDERFIKWPANYLLFGKGAVPHPSISAGESTFKERHRALLLRLKKEKKLGDITGLSLYSWKDTGMTEFAKILRPIELRDHARHASIDQSLSYYHAEKIQEGVKKAKIKVV